uniref:Protein kinase domain-containing protein n=1 Tax=Oryzias melastigma TaxID=30732 RepID=A0A3B3BHK4_ORYME
MTYLSVAAQNLSDRAIFERLKRVHGAAGDKIIIRGFICDINTVLFAQYLVEKFIGEGSFGKVAKCRNLSTNQEVAVKISKPTRRDAGLDEISALAKITKLDADKYGLIKFIERFEYRHHICIVYELLDQSLLDFMKARKHRPLLIHEIRSIARQLLISLKGLKEINMAHCDIKPDNIMLVNHASEPFRVKLIDFGLTKKPEDIEPGTTMQNIQYRAPEVILGLPLDERVDMWTVGYVLAWLYTGFHIHPDESTQVEMFINLLRQMIEIDPNKRITPEEALKHSFFTMEQPSADSEKSNSQESASPEVHQQPKTTTVPQETAAAPQEKTVKEDVLQQQEATKRNSQAGSRKRKRSDDQSQDPEQCSQTERAVKKSRIEIKEDIIQKQQVTQSSLQSPPLLKINVQIGLPHSNFENIHIRDCMFPPHCNQNGVSIHRGSCRQGGWINSITIPKK